MNPPPVRSERDGFHRLPEPWGPGPHTVEETPSAPALSPSLAATVNPRRGRGALSPARLSRRGAPLPGTPGLRENLQMLRSSSATVALPAGCGLLLASSAETDEQE